MYDAPPALGTIVEEGRGDLPFHLIHGEALVACAAWALGAARVTAVDLGTQWAGLVDSGEPFVLHDSLCPMTPADFIAGCVARSIEHDVVVVAVDRDGAVLSPVVLPATVVAELAALPSLDFAELLVELDARFPTERVLAPAAAARVTSLEDLAGPRGPHRPRVGMSGRMPALLAMAGRGRLPYASLHRSPLYLHALQALAGAGGHDVVVTVDEADRVRVTRRGAPRRCGRRRPSSAPGGGTGCASPTVPRACWSTTPCARWRRPTSSATCDVTPTAIPSPRCWPTVPSPTRSRPSWTPASTARSTARDWPRWCPRPSSPRGC